MKTTIHGEKLQERARPPCSGFYPLRRFFFRKVWCPRCGALPNRKCVTVDGDAHVVSRRGVKQLAPGLRRGGVHHERLERATDLTAIAARGADALYRLAFRRPTQPVARFDRTADLPLFRSTSDDRGEP